ncbi:hypothetical protein ABE437_00870 [Isoptericola cucumis]|uniref:hypothetical protein n=1 Tax=Isoptericola cucumis TaxID=1776856 RepID=UPI0032096929
MRAAGGHAEPGGPLLALARSVDESWGDDHQGRHGLSVLGAVIGAVGTVLSFVALNFSGLQGTGTGFVLTVSALTAVAVGGWMCVRYLPNDGRGRLRRHMRRYEAWLFYGLIVVLVMTLGAAVVWTTAAALEYDEARGGGLWVEYVQLTLIAFLIGYYALAVMPPVLALDAARTVASRYAAVRVWYVALAVVVAATPVWIAVESGNSVAAGAGIAVVLAVLGLGRASRKDLDVAVDRVRECLDELVLALAAVARGPAPSRPVRPDADVSRVVDAVVALERATSPRTTANLPRFADVSGERPLQAVLQYLVARCTGTRMPREHETHRSLFAPFDAVNDRMLLELTHELAVELRTRVYPEALARR